MKKQEEVNRCLSEGRDLVQKHLYRKALVPFQKAYRLGSLEATYEIGRLYMLGHNHDYAQAYSWLQLGANGGDRKAQYYLSKFYEFGLLGEYDMSQAYKWLKCAAEQNESRALLRLSLWYRIGCYVHRDLSRGWELLQKAAELGEVEAYVQIAREYETGSTVVDRDLFQAIKYYELAASAHHPEALYRLAVLYCEGEAVPQDLDRAIRYLEESSRLGCGDAQHYLALLCGTSLCHNIVKRYVLLRAAARQNHVQAMYDLGCLHLFGDRLIRPDREVAIKWLRQAAKLGHERAHELCEVYDGKLPDPGRVRKKKKI